MLGDIRGCLYAVLPGPGVYISEKHFMREQNVTERKLSHGRQILEGFRNAGDEGAMLKVFDDGGIFLPEHIVKISARFKIVEWIERHGLASRR